MLSFRGGSELSVVFQIPGLTSEEKLYKRLWKQYASEHLEQPHMLRDLHARVPELKEQSNDGVLTPEDVLHERKFPRGLDVLVLPSARYGPAFWHSHSFFEVVCVVSGQCENIFSSNTISMSSGDICILAPGTVHALSVFSDDCVVFNLIVRSATFEEHFLKALPQDGILSLFFTRALSSGSQETCLYFKSPRDRNLISLVLEMRQEYLSRGQYYGVLLNSLLTTFFIRLLRHHEQSIVQPSDSSIRADSQVIFILKYIEEHCRDLSLGELSSFFGYSERQMIRLLRACTGETFTSLIQTARMSRACEMLREPSIPVAGIVSEVGYANVSHFYKVFRQRYHMTPAQYRERYAASDLLVLRSEL